MTDQNGSVHTYEYDALVCQTADIVSNLASGVDGAIRRIGRTYEVRGMVETITSYSDTSGSTPVNEVLNVYNDFGQIVAQYQEHGGAVDVETTPVVTYGYADGWDNIIRLESMTYPNGRVLDYLYDDEAADKLSRIRTLRWDGTDVCQYSYLGLSTFVTTDYLEPEVRLDYAENNYAGFDRFGRVADLAWERYGSSPESLVHLQYGYDRVSNRTYKKDLVATSYNKAFDERYGYDGMHRLASFDRGVLNTAGTVITSPTYQQGWSLDATGNWDGFTQTDTADSSNTLTQSRTANPVNEITAINHTVGSTWATPEYDANGNMTVIPQPKEMTKTFLATWDAWNRLIKLEEPDDEDGWRTLQENTYDGQTWRIVVKTSDVGVFDQTRHVYFTSAWQAVEEQVQAVSLVTNCRHHCIWGLRHIDDSVLCDRVGSIASTSNERRYVISDVNWSAVAAVEPGFSDVDRYAYSAFGILSLLDLGFACKTDPSFPLAVLHCGYSHDPISGIALARHRAYMASLGVWVTRDPMAYAGGPSLYGYVRNNPVSRIDPLGLLDPCDFDPFCQAQRAIERAKRQIEDRIKGVSDNAINGILAAPGVFCRLADLGGNQAVKDVVTCACFATSIADMLPVPALGSNPYIEFADCGCNMLSAAQVLCQRGAGFGLLYTATTVADCASLPIGKGIGAIYGFIVGAAGGTAAAPGVGTVAGGAAGVATAVIVGDAIADMAMFVAQNYISQGNICPVEQVKACNNVLAMGSGAVRKIGQRINEAISPPNRPGNNRQPGVVAF